MDLVPIVVVDDTLPTEDSWREPIFTIGTERPRLEPGEQPFALLTECAIALHSRAAGQLDWVEVWHAPRPGTTTFTDRRMVIGCRPQLSRPQVYPFCGERAAKLHRQRRGLAGAKCLASQFRYEWVSHVSIRLAEPALPGLLSLAARGEDVVWRLSISAPGLAETGPGLAEAVATQVAQAHLPCARALHPAAVDVLRAQADGVRLMMQPGVGATAHLPAARPIGQAASD